MAAHILCHQCYSQRSKYSWFRELFDNTQCTKGDTAAAAADAAVDETPPWKSAADPIIKRPTNQPEYFR